MFRSLFRGFCLAGSLASLAALPMGAQEKSTKETKASSSVPQSAQPPAGMCRVWLENVPASQQPAPTDCATAIKNRPNNAHVVFGNLSEEAAKPAKKDAANGAANAPAANDRTNGWPTRLTDPPRRFDTGPGIPAHRTEQQQQQPQQKPLQAQPGAGGVQPVTSTVIRPSTDSAPKRRP